MNPRAREHRFRRLKELGCLACWLDGRPDVYPENHHLNLGGKAGQKRRGDEFTIPLCPWHHQGKPLDHYGETEMLLAYGPSLKLHSRSFRNKYGRDDVLLKKTNDLIRQRDEMASGWKHHSPEAEVSR